MGEPVGGAQRFRGWKGKKPVCVDGDVGGMHDLVFDIVISWARSRKGCLRRAYTAKR
jgi:hypothetical protein